MNRLFRAVVVAFGCTAMVTGSVDEAIAQTLRLPGTIEAEDFDQGAADVAYSDTTAGNTGGAYRSTNVDIETSTDTGGGYNLGWVAAGEWLKYTVNVTAAGAYNLEIRVAARGAGGIFHIEIDGVDRTGPITIPETGGWQQWTSVTKPGLNLIAGTQVWRVVMDRAGEFAVGNINFFRVVSATPAPGPGPAPNPAPAPSPVPIPAPSEPPAGGDPTATDIVLYASDVTTSAGNWVRGNYATGAGGLAMQSNDAGWSNANEALPAPADFFEARFTPVANKPYRVWMRLRANADSKFNDSIWLQFSGAVDADGAPLWRIGTLSGMLVNLESCANCGVSGWGWQTGAWWVPQDSIVRFPAASLQMLRVQTREDGVRIDQIILSPTTYLDSPPGTPINDTNIVPKSAGKPSPPSPPTAPSGPIGPSGPTGAGANARPTTSITSNPAGAPRQPATTLAFTAPPDHDSRVTSYSVAIFKVEDSTKAPPVDTGSLGKPSPAPNGEIAVDISGIVKSLPPGWYYLVVSAHYPTEIVPSSPSTPFPR